MPANALLPTDPVPEDADWRAFYTALRYGGNKHRALGQFLSVEQLQKYIHVETLRFASVNMDPEEYTDQEYFGEELSELLKDILDGVILADNVKKYQRLLSAYRSPSAKGLEESFQSIQDYEYKTVRTDPYLRVLQSNGGWNILVSIIPQLETYLRMEREVSFLYERAIQSQDIAHYLLIKNLADPPLKSYIPMLVRIMLREVPQHLSFYLREFPKEVEKQLNKFIHGDVHLLFQVDYNKYGRKLMTTLLPYTQWSKETKDGLRPVPRGYPDESPDQLKMYEYLGSKLYQ
jgi:hypothetical protein